MALQDLLLSAVETIYDCVGDTFDHQRALASLSVATDDTGLFLAEIWPLWGRQDLIGFHNVPEDAVAAMLKSFGDMKSNSMFKSLPKIPVGVPVLRRAFVSDEEYYQSPMYKKTSAPWGLHSEGVSILKKGLVSAVGCGFMRHPVQGEVDTDLLTKLAFLNKHYQRAMELQQRLSTLEQHVINANNVLDLVEFGMILFDESKALIFVNRSAERILEKADGLRLGRTGLHIDDRDAKSQFEELLNGMNAKNVSLASRAGGIVKVRRPSRKRNYNLMLVPMAAQKSGTASSNVAVLIFDPTLKRTTATKFFATSYGLTPAEALLALELAQGTSVENFAVIRNVSVNTVRTQLSSIFAKTDTKRQGELISLLLRITAGISLE